MNNEGGFTLRPLGDFGTIELSLVAGCIIVWMLVMWRNRKRINQAVRTSDYRVLLFIGVIWDPIIAFTARSMYDAGFVPEVIAILFAGMARFFMLILGLLLLWIGPPEGDLPK